MKDWRGNFVSQGVTAILTVTDDHKAEREKAKLEASFGNNKGSLKTQPQPQPQPQAQSQLQPTTPQPEVKRRKRVGEPVTPDPAQYAISMPTTPGPSAPSINQSPSYSLPIQVNPLNFSQHGYPMLSQINQIMQSSQAPHPMRNTISSQTPLTPLTNPHSINTQSSMSQPTSQFPFISQQFQFSPSMFAPPVGRRRQPPEIRHFTGTSLHEHGTVVTQPMPNGQMHHTQQSPTSQLTIQQQQVYATSSTPMPPHNPYQRTQQLPPSYITSVIPGEGPVTGGISVCVLGANFNTETEVFFGTVLAPVHKYMSDSCLVVTCPANKPGSVPVYTTTMAVAACPAETKIFRYVDNNEKMLMELALIVHSNTQTFGFEAEFVGLL